VPSGDSTPLSAPSSSSSPVKKEEKGRSVSMANSATLFQTRKRPRMLGTVSTLPARSALSAFSSASSAFA